MPQKPRTIGDMSKDSLSTEPGRVALARSAVRAPSSAARSAGVSQRAWLISDSSRSQSTPAIRTENAPSKTIIHCQGCSPGMLSCSRKAESGPEMIVAIAEPLRKMAIALPRSAAGSQRVK